MHDMCQLVQCIHDLLSLPFSMGLGHFLPHSHSRYGTLTDLNEGPPSPRPLLRL
jgi:hypothetical protein